MVKSATGVMRKSAVNSKNCSTTQAEGRPNKCGQGTLLKSRPCRLRYTKILYRFTCEGLSHMKKDAPKEFLDEYEARHDELQNTLEQITSLLKLRFGQLAARTGVRGRITES